MRTTDTMQMALGLVAAMAVALVAEAKPGDQLFEIHPDMAISQQDFGDAIAIQGQYVVIGAENRSQGTGSNVIFDVGTAFLFEAATGQLLHQLTPTDPPATRAFGTSVDIDGNRIIVGAEDDMGGRGAAYVFDTDGNQLFKLLADDGAPNSFFGEVTAISGNYAWVGAAAAAGAMGLGKAYRFDLTDAVPGSTLTATPFQPDDLLSSAEFGSVLDADGDLAIIGMDRLGRGGAAYVYNTDGELVRKFDPPINMSTGQPVRGFGRSVAISGNIALIGATPDEAQVSSTEFGRAYLFDIATGQQLFELLPSDSQPRDLFGEGVALSGNLAVVHARHEDRLGTVNTAYVFDVTTGTQLLQLFGTNVVAGEEAFEAVDIDGGRVVAGVEGFGAAPPGIVNSGKALVFDVLFGDYNADGRVDGGDYVRWRNTLGDAVERFEGADGDGDMVVDSDDFRLWKANYGLAAPVPLNSGAGGLALGSSGQVVPEPSSALLLGGVVAGIWLMRRSFARIGGSASDIARPRRGRRIRAAGQSGMQRSASSRVQSAAWILSIELRACRAACCGDCMGRIRASTSTTA